MFFGLGYNTGVCLDFAYKTVNNPNLEITAVEKDFDIICRIKDLEVPKHYKQWQNFLSGLTENSCLNFEKISIELHLGNVFDIRNKLKEKSFDVIFFDPFSHKVAPEFWTNDFLISIFSLLDIGGILTTYSGLKRVEALALENNFAVKRISALGRKKHSLSIIKNISIVS